MVNRSRALGAAALVSALFLAAVPADATIYTLTIRGTIAAASDSAYAYELTDRVGLFTGVGQSLAGKAFTLVYRIDTAAGWLRTPPEPGSTTTVYTSGISPYSSAGEAITASVTIGNVTVRNIGVGGSVVPAGADTQSQLALSDGPTDQLAINTGISETSYTRGGSTITGFNIRVNNAFSNGSDIATAITTGGNLQPFAFDWGATTGNGLVSFAGNGLATTNAYLQPTSAVMAMGVPEPASWAMMIGGFGMVGAGMRRRRALRTVTFG